MARTRWWLVVGGTLAAGLVMSGVGIASGCLPIAGACSGPGVSVLPADDPEAGEPSFGDPPELAAGQEISVVGFGYGLCDDTGGDELCSRNGQVTGPREVEVRWRQDGTSTVLGEGAIVDGGTAVLHVRVPDDAAPGAAHVDLSRGGRQPETTEVEVVAP